MKTNITLTLLCLTLLLVNFNFITLYYLYENLYGIGKRRIYWHTVKYRVFEARNSLFSPY